MKAEYRDFRLIAESRELVNLNYQIEFMQSYLQRTIGLVCLVIGILLIVHAHDVAQTPGEHVRRFSPWGPSDRSTYFYVAGALLSIFGASQLIWPAKPK